MQFPRAPSWLFVTGREAAAGLLLALALAGCGAAALALAPPPWTWLRHLQVERDTPLPSWLSKVLAKTGGAGRKGGDDPEPLQIAKMVADATAGDGPLVLLTGGSATRELTASGDYVSRMLSLACARPVRFVNAGSNFQSVAETWSIAEAAQRGRPELILVGFNYNSLREDPASVMAEVDAARVPLPPSRALENYLSADTGRLLLPSSPLHELGRLAAQLQRFQRAQATLRKDESPWQGRLHRHREPVLGAAEKEVSARHFIASRLGGFRENGEAAVRMWLAFARAFASPGTRVGFVALPYDPSFARLEPYFRPEFDAALARFAAAGIAVLDFRGTAALGSEDFKDHQHLVARGREHFSPVFTAGVAGLMLDCRPAAGAPR